MDHRESPFDNGIVNGAMFLTVLVGAVGVAAITRRELPSPAPTILGAVAVVPSFLLAYFVVYFIDRRRGPRQIASTHGITWSGVFYAEAVILAFTPAFADEDPGIDWSIAVPAWVLAVGCALVGREAKKRKRAREDMARLAQVNVNLATRFIVRPDKKGWSEIEPFTVVAYQRMFEKALAAIGEPLPESSVSLEAEQAERLIKAAEEGYFGFPERQDNGPFTYGPRYYPGPVVSLVLAYLDASPEMRARDRREWAAAITTRVDASAIRDAYMAHVAALFKKPSNR